MSPIFSGFGAPKKVEQQRVRTCSERVQGVDAIRPRGAVSCPDGAAALRRYSLDPSSRMESRSQSGTHGARAAWWLPTAFIMLNLVPIVAGAWRLGEVARGAEMTGANARFIADPIPAVIHIVSAALFVTFGAFQFLPSLRGSPSGWHRRAGRPIAAMGALAGASGIWLTWSYPPAEADSSLLVAFRLCFGSALVAAVILGVAAARRHQLARHRVWMFRAYAIALGAGTQFLLHIPWIVCAQKTGELSRALLMGGGWVVNLLVAELALRRTATSARAAPTLSVQVP